MPIPVSTTLIIIKEDKSDIKTNRVARRKVFSLLSSVGDRRRDSINLKDATAGNNEIAAAISGAYEVPGQIAREKTISGQCQRYRE
jgi:hypothetical protein